MTNPLSFFHKKPKPSAASLQKFMGPPQGTAAPKAAPPKAPKWSFRKQLHAVFPSLFKLPKTSKANASVATAQQNVVAAMGTNQLLVGDPQYRANLQTLATGNAPAAPGAVPQVQVAHLACIDDLPQGETQESYLAALNGPPPSSDANGAYAAYAQTPLVAQQVEQHLPTPSAATTDTVDATKAAVSQKAAEVKAALIQLMQHMEHETQKDKNGNPTRTVTLDDGRVLSATYSQHRQVLTVQDDRAFQSAGKFDTWVSIHTQQHTLHLNRFDDLDDHVNPGPALSDALIDIQHLANKAPATA